MSRGALINEYSIEGMKCQSCVEKISTAFDKAGIKNVAVTLLPPKLRIDSGKTISEEQVQQILSQAGNYNIVTQPHHLQTNEEERLTPLFVILGYIVGGVVLHAYLSNNFSALSLMTNFMGGFLVIFSMFKLLNLSGFADAYATYDILAARSRIYALLFPFIELSLGIMYFLQLQPLLANTITFLVMAISSIGVFQALKSKRKFQCACLGTALKLPMTKVTLIEDITMGAMALVMIIHQIGS